MPNTLITIPLSTELDHAQLLEIIQGLTDDIQSLIEDAGGDCEIDELDVGVASTSELAKEFHIPRVKSLLSFELDFENDGENGGAEIVVIKANTIEEAIEKAYGYIGAHSLTDIATKKCTYLY